MLGVLAARLDAFLAEAAGARRIRRGCMLRIRNRNPSGTRPTSSEVRTTGAVLFATLAVGPALTLADIRIIA